ncbi:MAG: hypothetical protein DMG55_29990 [Acidobacteria bacterium]|nr:MAG: hypothetical protein DMG55_29990 [Acidobacteriota bacterium]
MRVSQNTGVHIVKDGNRKRKRLGSSECSSYGRQNYQAWLAPCASPREREDLNSKPKMLTTIWQAQADCKVP